MAGGRKIERVLLIFPPVRLYRETMKLVFSPLGVAYLAAVMPAVVVRVRRENRLLEYEYGSTYQKYSRLVANLVPGIY